MIPPRAGIIPPVDWHRIWRKGSPKHFVVDCRSGLGNRIKTLVAGMRLAKKMPDRVFSVLWFLDNYHCLCPLRMLFDNTFLELSPEYFLSTGYIDHYSIKLRANAVNMSSPVDIIWVTEENFFYHTGDKPLMWGQHPPQRMANETIRAELQAEFAQLTPRWEIQNAVNTFVQQHFTGKYPVGVHIRRGDNAWANLNVPDTLFPPVIDAALAKAPSNTVLFITTDSPKTEKALMGKYGDRAVVYQKRSLERGSKPEAVQDALIDLLILSRTQHIIRTPSSTFGQVAAWIGDVTTTEVGPLEHQW